MCWSSCATSTRTSAWAFADKQVADWFAEAGLDLEESQEFEPRGGSEARLTVKLWLGRDRRLLIAEPTRAGERETA